MLGSNPEAKRQLSISSGLTESMGETCRLYVHAEQPEVNPARASGYQPLQCFKLGVCVCQTNRTLSLFSARLKKYIRSQFGFLPSEQGKKKTPSPARVLLRDRMIVLRLQSYSEGERLDQTLASVAVSKSTVFVHVGHVNFNTAAFAVLRLFPELHRSEGGVLQLQPPLPGDVGNASHGVATDLEFARDDLDLQRQWVVQAYTISTEEHHWMPDDVSLIPVVAVHGSESLCIWSGERQEMAKKPRKPPASGSNRAVQDADEEDMYLELEDLPPGDESDLQEEEPAALDQESESAANCSSEDEAAAGSDDEADRPVPAAAAAESDDAALRAARAAGPRDMLSTVAFEVPDVGEVRYYPQSNTLVAFCRQEGHGDCRRGRTTLGSDVLNTPLQRGQGRPLGALLAWLSLKGEYASGHARVHQCKPTAQQRSDAREAFLLLRGARAFSEKAERPKRGGEDEEPARIR